MNKDRLNALKKLMHDKGIAYLLISTPENQFYYTGFSGGDGIVLISDSGIHLFTDPRYKEQAENEAKDSMVNIFEGRLEKGIADFINDSVSGEVYFESSMPYSVYEKIEGHLKKVHMRPAGSIADIPREIKDKKETELIKKACDIAEDAFSKTLAVLRPGISENDAAAEIEYNMRKAGAQGPAFKTTVASGKRSSLPHGTASDKIICNNEIVTFDFGALYGNYCSDITRTVFIGSCSAKQREIYGIVLCAQETALGCIEDGMTCQDADRIARQIITSRGYGNNFGHGLGHGLGLHIHENPRLSPYADRDAVLKDGMAVTIEPGIYIENDFGVRIEDTVMVRGGRTQVFTSLSKEIIIL